ncbi:MAG: hypothetical protein COB83_09765 [Gammaproteobacteria bacterium]|nr:MAG: hypothetical protein COB83_09765 [Gammaproteobacteria bacterium]
MIKIVIIDNSVYAINENIDSVFICKRGFLNLEKGTNKKSNWKPNCKIGHIKKNGSAWPLKFEREGKIKELVIEKVQATFLSKPIQIN